MTGFSWSDFADFAATVAAENKPSQAKLRIATSRCYYAARGYAADLLGKKHSIHYTNNSNLISAIEQYYSNLHADLKTLWDARVAADYHKNASFSVLGLKTNLGISRSLIASLKAENTR